MRVRVNKIGSVTRRLGLAFDLALGESIDCIEGSVVAARVLNEKSSYNQLEDVHGRMVPLRSGDIIVGALGQRFALHGYAGVVPDMLGVGERLQLLNLGGVLGQCTSQNPDIGAPFELEVLGQVLEFPEFQSRRGVPANLTNHAAGAPDRLPTCPVVAVCGACMNSGKTAAASVIVSALVRQGLKVGAAKLTGVSLLRDILTLRDYGAEVGYDFTDVGLPSTSADNAAPTARKLLGLLAAGASEAIVLEMGDGILGQYGVQQILADKEVCGLITVLVYCAADPAGAYGGERVLRENYGLVPDIVAGPVTDNIVGKRFVEQELGITAINARGEAAAFAARLGELLLPRKLEASNAG